ncbi:MAG: repair protein RecO [Candidatus Parcubacteria bacterium]|jgi:recombinational DNA repair protein (RecF pathway)|nr:repair protein RecO [Candidatus Parcubacteria bacterium]
MYSIETTPGFIIDSRPYGEAGRILYIFTRDLGLIEATAKGIRLEKSKLRYFAAAASFGLFSLVRGREFWRLVSAREIEPPVGSRQAENFGLLPRLAALLKRLLRGEEAQPALFDRLMSSARILSDSLRLTGDRLKTLESVTVLRMLGALGYIGDDPLLPDDIHSSDITLPFLDKLTGERPAMNRHINKALKESQL